jgi:hypothetical protein
VLRRKCRGRKRGPEAENRQESATLRRYLRPTWKPSSVTRSAMASVSRRTASRMIKIAIPVAGCASMADNVRNELIRLGYRLHPP